MHQPHPGQADQSGYVPNLPTVPTHEPQPAHQPVANQEPPAQEPPPLRQLVIEMPPQQPQPLNPIARIARTPLAYDYQFNHTFVLETEFQTWNRMMS